MAARQKTQKFDIVISGGGMVGMTLACGLATCGLKVTVIDATLPQTQLAKTFDGRASAIAYASYRMLSAIGFWKFVESDAQAIEQIRVSDKGSFLFVHFGDENGSKNLMGYMVENRYIRNALYDRANELTNLSLIAPEAVVGYTASDSGVTVKLESGGEIKASLLVAAEGRMSRLRDQAGIATNEWTYPQAGIVATIKHELPHSGIACEKFFPEGPFAILPLTKNRSSLVWTTRKKFAPIIMNFADDIFEHEVQEKVGDFLGCVKVTGPRWSYPLSFLMVERYTDDRLVLVGDAAHRIHPIAGQGLNLGFRDIAALIEVLSLARGNGEDIGSTPVLARYEQWRRTDNVMLGAITDGLNRLFSNEIPPIKLIRNAGFGLVNKSPQLKKLFISHARGTFGKLPSLLKGKIPN